MIFFMFYVYDYKFKNCIIIGCIFFWLWLKLKDFCKNILLLMIGMMKNKCLNMFILGSYRFVELRLYDIGMFGLKGSRINI